MAVIRKKEIIQHALAPNPGSASALLAELTAADIGKFPLNVENVAEYLGLEVIEELMDDDISGFLEFKNGSWVAGLNALHHRNRQRFTLAHEIAHFVLHRSERASFVDQTFARRAGSGDRIESEADRFAADLLMPEDAVRAKVLSGVSDLNELARAFQVSALAMRYRVKNLGFRVK